MSNDIEAKVNAWRARRSELAPYVSQMQNGPQFEKEREFLHSGRVVEALEAALEFERSKPS